jgi:uncharacterized protein (TIRG00374 family)
VKELLKSKRFQSLLGFGVSLGLIGWMIFYVDDWHEVGQQLKQIRYWPFIPVTIIFYFHFVLRALRWRYLLPEGGDARLKNLFDAILVGAFASFVLPLRAGEFIRPYMLTRKTKYSFSSAFVSVVIERFFDLSVVLISFGIMLFFIKDIPHLVHQGALSLTVMAVLIFIFIIAGSLMPQRILRLTEICLKPLPARVGDLIGKFLRDFLNGAVVISNPGALAMVVVLSLLVWSTSYLQFYLFLYSFDVQPDVWLAISTGVIVALAVAAPSAPGFIGVYQGGCIIAFALFGVRKEVAVAFAIITHIYQYVMCIGSGIVVLLTNNLKLSELQKKDESA